MIAAPFGGTNLDLKKKKTWKKEDYVAYFFVVKLVYPVVTLIPSVILEPAFLDFQYVLHTHGYSRTFQTFGARLKLLQ